MDRERRPVKVGIGMLNKPLTRAKAQRWDELNMPADLKAAGFEVVILRSDRELHDGTWFRVNDANRLPETRPARHLPQGAGP